METATLVGGCFWCTEAIFKRLKGVISVESGYSEEAEAVQIRFDPGIISFKHLLDIFWVMHDPTTLNRQGPDIGTQYRSVIFYHNDKQKDIALRSRKKIKNAVTEILPFEKFYTAKEYHQNYYERNMGINPYCSLVISPKIQKLLDKFNNDVKEEYYGFKEETYT